MHALSILLILQGRLEAGANTNWLQMRGGVYPGQVINISQGLKSAKTPVYGAVQSSQLP